MGGAPSPLGGRDYSYRINSITRRQIAIYIAVALYLENVSVNAAALAAADDAIEARQKEIVEATLVA